MKKLFIGIVLVALGLPGTAYFFPNLVGVIIGGLPVLLILGGPLPSTWDMSKSRRKKRSNLPPLRLTHMMRAKKILPPPDFNTPDPLAPEPSEQDMSTPASTGYAGNTDTHVFHSITCNFAKGKKCTVEFTDRDDAIAQGFKSCKICNP